MRDDTKTNLMVFASVLFVVGLACYGAILLGNHNAEVSRVYREWKHKCIDAGGTPVSILEYVKGIGDGERCVKLGEVIEVK